MICHIYWKIFLPAYWQAGKFATPVKGASTSSHAALFDGDSPSAMQPSKNGVREPLNDDDRKPWKTEKGAERRRLKAQRTIKVSLIVQLGTENTNANFRAA